MAGQNFMYLSQAGVSPSFPEASLTVTPVSPLEEGEEATRPRAEDLGQRKKLLDPNSMTLSLGSKPKQQKKRNEFEEN
jgi:hypothetical protein